MGIGIGGSFSSGDDGHGHDGGDGTTGARTLRIEGEERTVLLLDAAI
jgi:hypothetical protein